MTSPDRALVAAGAAPGVADPVQPVAAQLGRGLAEPYRANRDVVVQRSGLYRVTSHPARGFTLEPVSHRSSIARLTRRVTRRTLSRQRLAQIIGYTNHFERRAFAA